MQEQGRSITTGALGTNVVCDEVKWASELHSFATAATGLDEVTLRASREQLISVMGHDAMIDAAAVVANFEMMTRLADATGARLPPERVAANEQLIERFGMTQVASRR